MSILSPNDRYRKRKGDEWRLVDVGLLPPLENVDPDRLKLFSKDEIRSYLRHYGMSLSRHLEFAYAQLYILTPP